MTCPTASSLSWPICKTQAAYRRLLEDIQPTHVFFTAWSPQNTEAENLRVNQAMIRNLFDALAPAETGQHAALMPGLKHYMGPVEAFGTREMRETPFREESERLDRVASFWHTDSDLGLAVEVVVLHYREHYEFAEP